METKSPTNPSASPLLSPRPGYCQDARCLVFDCALLHTRAHRDHAEGQVEIINDEAAAFAGSMEGP